LEVCSGGTVEKIAVNLVERYSGVKVDAVLLQPDLFEDKLRGELPEQFAHGFHALGASLHILGGVTHGEEHGLDTLGARRVVQVGISVGYIRHADESGSGLCLIDRFLEALQAADTAEGEAFRLREAVGCGEPFKESRRIICLIMLNTAISRRHRLIRRLYTIMDIHRNKVDKLSRIKHFRNYPHEQYYMGHQ